ncbi:ankyrin repeat-containing domain protein [Mycena vulgaris]|nr:ankyrin repeat-containing domain protein [Mycena vulgaris]
MSNNRLQLVPERVSTVIEEITVACPERSAVAYFYFDFKNERQCMDIMLRSIIWQLSGWSPSPYSALHRLYKTLGNGTIQPQHVHLQGVLADLLSGLDRTYIVIDGLDECDKTDWKPLVQFIHSLRHPTKNALHLLFTSQTLEEFQKAFKDVTFIELGSAVSTGDIRSSVGSEVPRVGNRASDDKFRMVACLFIELGGCYWEENWEETLTALLTDLFGIYGRFLTRAKVSLPTVTSDELADAIAFRLSDAKFDFSDPAKSIYYPNRRRGNSDGFKLLEGLIVIKNDSSAKSSIDLTHSSVRDYILASEFQRKFGAIIEITRDVSHKFIAQTCVRYLLFSDSNHSMTQDTLPDYPISLYAAKYWPHHPRLCDDRDQEALISSTMHLLEDGSSQHAALYQLRRFTPYRTQVWGRPISALCMCSEMGYTEGVRFLLIKYSTAIDQTTKDGKTALHSAVRSGHLDVTQLLIEHSASVDQTTKDARLHSISQHGLVASASASVDQAENDGWTALHFAARSGRLSLGQLLIAHSASVDQAASNGCTALHFPSVGSHLDVAQLLIEHSAYVDQAENNGWTALHFATQSGRLNVAQLLIEHSASVDQTDNNGWTALHFATQSGRLNVAQLLIEHSASMDQATKDGRTALHFASEGGHLDVTRLLSASVERTAGGPVNIDASLPSEQSDRCDETAASVS